MNRHQRRVVAKNKRLVSSIEELSGAAEKLAPYLVQFEDLQSQLANVQGALEAARLESESVHAALSGQRELFFKVLARCCDVPVDAVLSIAEEVEDHGIANTGAVAADKD